MLIQKYYSSNKKMISLKVVPALINCVQNQ